MREAVENTRKKIRSRVLEGNVINRGGQWVALHEAVAEEKEILNHIKAGDVFISGAWTKIASAKSSPLQREYQAGTPAATNNRRLSTQTPIKLVFSNDGDFYSRLLLPEKNSSCAIVSIGGYIDNENTKYLESALNEAGKLGFDRIILDFEHCIQVGSSGWGIISAHARRLKAAQGYLRIAAMSLDVWKSFELLQFDKIIDSFDTIDECLHAQGEAARTEDKADHASAGNDIFAPAHAMRARSAPRFIRYRQRVRQSWRDMPIREKIRKLIMLNGPLPLLKMWRMLRSEECGKTAIGLFPLYRTLVRLRLDTRTKQMRFYRSC